MQTKVSSKGQVVLPGPLRRRLGLRPGDVLDANIEAGSILLTPKNKRHPRAKIVTDPITGFPVLTTGADSPKLTSKEVEEILASFP
jgi:AbrB family looped-hinge helix DNA binding protein